MDETYYILIHYRGPEGCANFDQYLLVPADSSPADIFNTAVDNLYDYQANHYQPPRSHGEVCDPTEYSITIGPALAELA